MSAHSQIQDHGKREQRNTWVKQSTRSLDTNLAEAATDAIACLTTIPQETITITARNGWLHLEGTVSYRHQRTILEDVTRNLPGVRGVTDWIIIEATIR